MSNELLWHFFTQGEEAIFKYREYTAVARTANQAESRPPNHGHVMTGEMFKILDTYIERHPARQQQQRICILPFFGIL